MARTPRNERVGANSVLKYNIAWKPTTHPLWIEIQMIAWGGQWKKKDGEMAGEGLFFHYKEAIRLCWPDFAQHRWFDLFLDNWLTHKYVAVIGPKSSGKTSNAAICHLLDYYTFPACTTTIVCSDTMENLEDRIWGEIKKYHRIAKEQFSWLPGQLIEGRMRLVTDRRDESTEGRDFRNGMVGIPVKKGSAVVGLSSFVGRKNKRVRICGDELSLLNKTFIDAIASQANLEVKITGMGNPSQTTDALGLLAEPATELGGWDGGIDQTPKTKTWRTRWPNGIAIQYPGDDCPNMDVGSDEPVPYPFLITRKQMQEDAKIWGRDDWHFAMFNLGMMPRGQGSRRVITRQLCVKHGALKEPVWQSPNRSKIVGLDAAYRSVGGDRCVLVTLEFGEEGVVQDTTKDPVQAIIDQTVVTPAHRQIIALASLSIIPIKSNDFESPEDQIVMFTKMHCEAQNIPPRNVFYDSGMRTSLVTSFGRLWSVDVNAIDCGGKPSERPVSDNIDVRCCDYYSKRITEFWYTVRLIIEAGQFRGMTEDVMLEGCAREWKTVSGNRIEVETKADMREKTGRSPDLFDALCFQKNTTVSTPTGGSKIQDIKPGDLVLTPFGPERVAFTHCQPVEELCLATFSNGAELCGTGGHKIFTNRGWVRLDALAIDMEVESVHNLWIWRLLDSLFTRDANTGFKAMVDTIHEVKNTVNRRDFFIESCGESITDSFQRGIASIIRTVIGRITTSPIWSWLKLPSTSPTTCAADQTFSNASPMKFRQSGEFMPQSGTELRRGWSGTVNTEKSLGWEENGSELSAMNAENVSTHFSKPEQGSVQYRVHSNLLGKILQTVFCDGVMSAARRLKPIAIIERCIAPVTVRQLRPHESSLVYNLTLENHNAYYANGILVANCQAVEGARQRGFHVRRLVNKEYVETDSRWKGELKRKALKLVTSKQLNYAA